MAQAHKHGTIHRRVLLSSGARNAHISSQASITIDGWDRNTQRHPDTRTIHHVPDSLPRILMKAANPKMNAVAKASVSYCLKNPVYMINPEWSASNVVAINADLPGRRILTEIYTTGRINSEAKRDTKR